MPNPIFPRFSSPRIISINDVLTSIYGIFNLYLGNRNLFDEHTDNRKTMLIDKKVGGLQPQAPCRNIRACVFTKTDSNID